MKPAMFDSSIAQVCLRACFVLRARALARRNWLILLPLFLAAGCDSPPPPPAAPVPLSFVGSTSCNECHAPQVALWQESQHALAMQPATPESVLGDFSGVEFDHFGLRSRFFTEDGKFLVKTDNKDGELQVYAVKYTFGVAPLQQYLVEMPNGHVQPLPLAWDSRSSDQGGQRWFHLYPDAPLLSDDPLHWTGREQNWNYMCAECHSTNLQKNYNLASDSFATTWSEINVGCEGCHGPASRHVARAKSGSGGAGLTVDLDDHGRSVWQMNVTTGIADRTEMLMRAPSQPEACGRCHARRSLATGDYEFGRPLHDTHVPALLDEFLYYPDGQIQEEVYVYGSFLQSRMYQAGVSCSDCHDPHSARLKTAGEPSDVCSTCHLPTKFSTTGHHRHQAEDVACVDCHMASRTYMGVDDRRDHSFRLPRPDLTLSTGSPNACNQCHDDRDAQWALDAVQAWYGPQSRPHYAQAIHAGRNRTPQANEMLVAVADDGKYPGIARATSLSLLQAPYSRDVLETINISLSDADSLLRSAALGALSAAAPEIILEWAPRLLSDPVRSVRIEAARVLSPLQASLQDASLAAFRAANMERSNAQTAIAERPEAHMNLGNLHADAGDIAQAEADFRQALSLEPRAVAARVNLAELLVRSGRPEEAEQLLRDGIVNNENEAALHHSLGLLLVRANRPDEALSELSKAASLQPDQARFVFVHAVALNSLGHADQAIQVLADAARRFPSDFDISWGLATILRDAGRLDEAREVAQSLTERFPDVQAARDLLQAL